MNYRKLIGHDMYLSEIGFGAWGIGGITPGATSYGVTDDLVSSRALRTAYDEGVNYFDTSNMYGLGHSESLIGKELSNVRDRIVICTKAGLFDYNEPGDYGVAAINSSLEASLKRLNTDYVDILYLHNLPIDEDTNYKDCNDCFDALKQSGKVRYTGLSVRSPEEALIALGEINVDIIQTNFNLMDYRILDLSLLQQARETNVSIIARSPLAAGFLAGEVGIDTMFDKQDHRSRFNQDIVAVWLDMVNQFKGCLDPETKETLLLMALRFCLSFSGIVSVIPGTLSQKQVLENVEASNRGRLSDKKLEELAAIYRYGEQKIKKRIELNKSNLMEGKRVSN